MSLEKNTDTESKFLHEIATPLSIILFQLEASIKLEKSDDVRNRLQQALEQTRKVVASLEARRERIK